jgi:hypothetical protein
VNPPADNLAARLAKKAKQSIVSGSSAVAGKSTELAGRLKSATASQGTMAANSARQFLTGYLPQIRDIIAHRIEKRLLTPARNAIGNDELMRKTFGAAYDCLPKPVRRFVAEKEFIEFCLLHRRKLVPEKEGSDSKVPGED